MNPTALTDVELSNLLQQVKDEVSRRTDKQTQDAGALVRGQEYAKRAIVVAAAGDHPMVFWGCPSSKTELRALANDLGVKETWELLPCPCGWLNDSLYVCQCELKEIKDWRKDWKTLKADIWIEVVRVSEREMTGKMLGTTAKDMKKQIQQAGNKPAGMDGEAATLLSHAVNELGLSPRERKAAFEVASTIAALENSKAIESRHVAEAVNYRKPQLRNN